MLKPAMAFRATEVHHSVIFLCMRFYFRLRQGNRDFCRVLPEAYAPAATLLKCATPTLNVITVCILIFNGGVPHVRRQWWCTGAFFLVFAPQNVVSCIPSTNTYKLSTVVKVLLRQFLATAKLFISYTTTMNANGA